MTEGRYTKAFIVVLGALILWSLLCRPAWAKRTIVITYDVSGSMIGPKDPKVGPRKTAEELEATARATLELVFHGEPFENPDFEKYATNCSFTETFRSKADSVHSPFWRPGDDLVFIKYGDQIWETVKITNTEWKRPDDLFEQLLAKAPYPRGFYGKPSGKASWDAFKRAFPDKESLQKLAEVEALKVLDQMVQSGNQKAQVIWVSVSDEDTDTTEFTTVKSEHQRLSQNLAVLKDRYREMQDFFAYQVLAANFIWIRARVLSLVDTGVSDAEITRLNELQEKFKWEKEEAERLAGEARLAAEEAERRKKEAIAAAREAERQTKDALEKAEKAREELKKLENIKLQARKLYLNIEGREIEEEKVVCRVLLQRIPADGTGRKFKLELPDIHFISGADASDGDFEILKLYLQIKDARADLIGTYQLTPKPVGEALHLSLPDDAVLREKAVLAALTAEYKYRDRKDTDDKPFTKTWHFHDFSVPSPGWLAENLWLMFVLLGLVVLVVAYFMTKNLGKKDKTPHVYVEEREKHGSRRPEGGYTGRPGEAGETAGAKPVNRVRLTVAKGGKFPPLDLDGNHPLEVSLAGGNRRGFRGGQSWNLDAPDNTLEWDGRNLTLNGAPVSGKTFEIVNQQGKKLKIKYKKL